MRLLYIYTFFILLLFSLTSCTTTNYYIVRHAEKLYQNGDTPLSEAGFCRAQRLAKELSDKEISVIFVSDQQRTQQTAMNTAKLFEVTPTIIPEAQTDELIKQLEKVNGKNVLVVRHSPEIHLIVNALSPSDTIDEIDDEFDNLFVIRKRVFPGGETSIQLERLKYGPEHYPVFLNCRILIPEPPFSMTPIQ